MANKIPMSSPFYAPPRAGTLYQRGNYGPPIWGEYRDRWTGKEWLRGDGSRAPLAGFAAGMPVDLSNRDVRKGAIPFVRTAAAVKEQEQRMSALDAMVPPPKDIATSLLVAEKSFSEKFDIFWNLHKEKILIGGAGIAGIGIVYMLMRRK